MPNNIYKNDSPEMRELAHFLVPRGYVRRYEVRGRNFYSIRKKHLRKNSWGGKVYRIAFAHPQRKIALILGKRDEQRTKMLRSLGWRVIRLASPAETGRIPGRRQGDRPLGNGKPETPGNGLKTRVFKRKTPAN